MVLQSKMRQEDPSAYMEELGWVVQPCCSITKSLGYNCFAFLLLHVYSEWNHIYTVYCTSHWSEREKSHTKDSKMKDLWFKQFSYFFYHRNLEFTGTACFCKYLIEWKNVAHHKKGQSTESFGKKVMALQQGSSPGHPSILSPKGCGAEK